MVRLTAILACLVDGALSFVAIAGEQATLGLSLAVGLMSLVLQFGFVAVHSVLELWDQPY